tara:strand:- start:730 stop:1158 length:429 start_codon:yes stop_codon:yes gene_type:complete
MGLFARFSPGLITPKGAARTRRRIRGGLRNASCVFFSDRNNWVQFKMNPAYGGVLGNNYSVTLYYTTPAGRFNLRLFKNSDGSLVGQKTITGGMANLPAGVAANPAMSPILTCTMKGTIADTKVFSAGVTFADAKGFQGGRG